MLKDIQIDNCTKEIDGILWKEFCVLQNNTKDRDFLRNPDAYRLKEDNWNCDPYFQGMIGMRLVEFGKIVAAIELFCLFVYSLFRRFLTVNFLNIF